LSEEEEAQETTEEVPALEVKIVNKDSKEKSIYDDSDDEEYDSLAITEEELKDFDSSSG